MKHRTLGRTGIKVSPYCLGAMMFGKGGNPDRDECICMIHKSLDFGINFIDTADAYSRGESEEIVGEALKGRRDSVVIGTKFFHPMGDGANQRGGSRRWIIQAMEDSLKRLHTDYIDLYQLHRPDPDTAIEETLSALSDLVRAGKVRAIGTTTFPASAIVEAQWVAEQRGLVHFRAEQQPYSILNRGIEREVLPTCERWGMGVTAWGIPSSCTAATRPRAKRPSPQSGAKRGKPTSVSSRPTSRRWSMSGAWPRKSGTCRNSTC